MPIKFSEITGLKFRILHMVAGPLSIGTIITKFTNTGIPNSISVNPFELDFSNLNDSVTCEYKAMRIWR